MATIDSPLLHLHPDDNVFVAKSALALGQTISELGVRTRAQVPAGQHRLILQVADDQGNTAEQELRLRVGAVS